MPKNNILIVYFLQRVLYQRRGGDLHQDRVIEWDVCAWSKHRLHRPLPRPETTQAGTLSAPLGRHQLRPARDEPVEVESSVVL